MHIDVNNAFLSWTALYLLKNGSKYDIRNSYAVIGGDEKARSGIVLAKSMHAKKLGIKTGETLYSARRKCKVLKTYPPNFNFYEKMSNKLFELIKNYTEDIEIASVDECYIDYTPIKDIYGNEVEFAKKLKQEIYDTLGFTVNIGIANNKLCAKMASDFKKPNRIHTLYEHEIKEKMWPLKVGELFGIGIKTALKLNEINIFTIKDLATTDEHYLYKFFKNQSVQMINKANGIDNTQVISKRIDPKGIGTEITLTQDIKNKEILSNYIEILVDKITKRLLDEKKYANVIVIVLKNNKFKRYSHQKKLKTPTNDKNLIKKIAKELLDEVFKEDSIRLIGIRLNNLTDKITHQVSIFENENKVIESRKVDIVLNEIKEKYGANIITKASEKK